MKKEDLAELKSLLKEDKQLKSLIKRISSRKRITERAMEKLNNLNAQRDSLAEKMKPLQDMVSSESASFHDPIMELSINLYYHGDTIKQIRETLDYSEAHMIRILQEAEGLLIS